jgi:hypothetical protein
MPELLIELGQHSSFGRYSRLVKVSIAALSLAIVGKYGGVKYCSP